MHTTRSTPSSTIIALAIVVVAIVLASWLIKRTEKITPQETSTGTTTVVTRVRTQEKDSDGDGLMDWEEVLWGFDPQNPDTNGDGTTDDVEQKKSQETLATRQTEFAALIDPRTIPGWDSVPYPEKVSELLITKYLSSKQDGIPLTPDKTQEIVSSIPTYTLPQHEPPKLYTSSDLTISTASGKDRFHTYGNAVGSALSTSGGETAPNELFVLIAFLQGGDTDTFVSDLHNILFRYDIVIQKLLAVSVPQELATKHLAVLNALSLIQNDLERFDSFTQDPFLALSVFSAYNEDSSRRGAAFDALRAALTAAGVTFSDTESGSVLMSTTSS